MRQVESIVEFLIYASSVVGLLLSAALAIRGLVIFPSPMTGVFATVGKWVLLALFPVGFAFVLRYQSLTRDWTRRKVRHLQYSGCPPWMKRMAYCNLGIGVVLFFLPGVLEMVGYIPKGDYSSFGKEFPSTVAGGFGLMAYSAFFAQLYSIKALVNPPMQPTGNAGG
jgi:hypothetical protein